LTLAAREQLRHFRLIEPHTVPILGVERFEVHVVLFDSRDNKRRCAGVIGGPRRPNRGASVADVARTRHRSH